MEPTQQLFDPDPAQSTDSTDIEEGITDIEPTQPIHFVCEATLPLAVSDDRRFSDHFSAQLSSFTRSSSKEPTTTLGLSTPSSADAAVKAGTDLHVHKRRKVIKDASSVRIKMSVQICTPTKPNVSLDTIKALLNQLQWMREILWSFSDYQATHLATSLAQLPNFRQIASFNQYTAAPPVHMIITHNQLCRTPKIMLAVYFRGLILNGSKLNLGISEAAQLEENIVDWVAQTLLIWLQTNGDVRRVISELIKTGELTLFATRVLSWASSCSIVEHIPAFREALLHDQLHETEYSCPLHKRMLNSTAEFDSEMSLSYVESQLVWIQPSMRRPLARQAVTIVKALGGKIQDTANEACLIVCDENARFKHTDNIVLSGDQLIEKLMTE